MKHVFILFICIALLIRCGSDQQASGKTVNASKIFPASINKPVNIASAINVDTEPAKVSAATKVQSSPGSMNEESVCVKVDSVLYEGKKEGFTVFPLKDTIFYTTGGNFVFIPKKSLVGPSGIPDTINPITVNIKEFQKPSDFLLSGLMTTTKDGQRLETGGTIFIEALQNGNQLNVSKDTSLLLGFKSDSPLKEDMELYEGTVASNGGVLWDFPMTRMLTGKVRDAIIQLKSKGTRYKEFHNGKISLEEYVAQKIHLVPDRVPRIEIDNIYVNFEINSKGYASEVKISGAEDPIIENKLKNIIQFMDKWEPFKPSDNVSGQPISNNVKMSISFVVTIDLLKGKVLLEESKDPNIIELARLAENEKHYTLRTVNIGWINCDRFMETPKEALTSVKVKDINISNAKVIGIYRKNPGMVNAISYEGGSVFTTVPKDEWFDVITIRKKGATYYYSYYRDCALAGEINIVKEEPYSIEKLKEKIIRDFNSFSTNENSSQVLESVFKDFY